MVIFEYSGVARFCEVGEVGCVGVGRVVRLPRRIEGIEDDLARDLIRDNILHHLRLPRPGVFIRPQKFPHTFRSPLSGRTTATPFFRFGEGSSISISDLFLVAIF